MNDCQKKKDNQLKLITLNLKVIQDNLLDLITSCEKENEEDKLMYLRQVHKTLYLNTRILSKITWN